MDINYKEFYEWCLRKAPENTSLYTYEEFVDMCGDMGSWFDEILPLYQEFCEEAR